MLVISDRNELIPLQPAIAKFASTWGSEFWTLEQVCDSLDIAGTKIVLAPSTSGLNEQDDAGVARDWTGLLLIREVGGRSMSENGQAEVFFIYTLPRYRGRGIGRALLLWQLEAWRNGRAIGSCFLEVRSSNDAARKLYESIGFQLIQRRHTYYRDGEDALIYQWKA